MNISLPACSITFAKALISEIGQKFSTSKRLPLFLKIATIEDFFPVCWEYAIFEGKINNVAEWKGNLVGSLFQKIIK